MSRRPRLSSTARRLQQRLRQALDERRVTLSDLRAATALPFITIRSVRDGIHVPRRRTMELLVAALDHPADPPPLRVARLKAKLSARTVASALGLPYSTYLNAEFGVRALTNEQLRRFGRLVSVRAQARGE